MMLTIFESRARRRWVSEGALISLTVHAILIGAAVAATRPAAPAAPEEVNETVRFLVPMDRVLGRKTERPVLQRLEYAVEGKGGGNEGQILRKVERRAVADDDAAGQGPTEGELQPPTPPPTTLGDTVLTVVEVDSAVTRYPDSAAPAYPAGMLAKNVEGWVSAQFIVDTLGMVDTLSFRVLSSTHPEFIDAVRVALPGMRFHPAIARSQKVRQLVQQAFSFKIASPSAEHAETAKGPKKP